MVGADKNDSIITSSANKVVYYLGCYYEIGAPRDSLTAPIWDWLRIGKSIHTTFTDWGYLDVAMAVH